MCSETDWDSEQRLCEVCGKPLQRRSRETESEFENKAACGKKCALVLKHDTELRTYYRRLQPDCKLYCLICGDLIPRGTRPNGRLESVELYGKRKLCGKNECRNEYNRRVGAYRRQQPVDKQCAVCGETVYKPLNQITSVFLVADTCSSKCSRKLALKTMGYKEAEKKRCVICREPFGKNPKETHKAYHNRQICSMKCRNELFSQRARSGPENQKVCPVCGDLMIRRKGESLFNFKNRKTCSVACGRNRKTKEQVEERKRELREEKMEKELAL